MINFRNKTLSEIFLNENFFNDNLPRSRPTRKGAIFLLEDVYEYFAKWAKEHGLDVKKFNDNKGIEARTGEFDLMFAFFVQQSEDEENIINLNGEFRVAGSGKLKRPNKNYFERSFATPITKTKLQAMTKTIEKNWRIYEKYIK